MAEPDADDAAGADAAGGHAGDKAGARAFGLTCCPIPGGPAPKPLPTLAGVDGCRAGWIAVVREPGSGAATARVFPRFDFLIDALGPDAIVCVDMPIGLPERIEGAGRVAEQAARALLGPRSVSLFSVPARAAVEAGAGPFLRDVHRHEAHGRACAIAERLSHPPRRISIQAFGLFPKIMEIDRLLAAKPGLADRISESHPELAFTLLNGGRPMEHAKKLKGVVNPLGMEERRRLLLAAGIQRDLLYSLAPAGAAQDDLLDACALLFVAQRRACGTAIAFPDPPGRDARGLPIAIWA